MRRGEAQTGEEGEGSDKDRTGGIVIHFVLWSLLAPLN